MKRIVTVLLLLALLAGCACGRQTRQTASYPLTINATPIDSEVFTFYLDKAVNALPEGTQEERINYAVQLCIHYVAVNSAFSGAGTELTPVEKKETSDDTDVRWRTYGSYYGRLGVSKQTYAKIQLNERYVEKLRAYYFGEGGPEEIPVSALKEYLGSRYVSFRAVVIPKKTVDVYGNEKERDEAQNAALQEKLSAGLNAINNNGTGIESVFATFAADRNGDREEYREVVTDGTDHAYSQEFVDTVKAVNVGTAAVLDYGDALYLVYRENIQADEDIFETYRDECLTALSESALLAKLDEIARGYSSTVNQPVAAECWNNYWNAVKAGQ